MRTVKVRSVSWKELESYKVQLKKADPEDSEALLVREPHEVSGLSYWVALENHRPLGYCTVNSGHLEYLYVTPTKRHQGIASALLMAAKPRGVLVRRGNDGALLFYRSVGFKEMRSYKDPYYHYFRKD